MKKMKQLIAFVCMLLCAANLAAQEREMIPVDWQHIRQEVNDNPQHVKDLVARLSAATLDTTLTKRERILAFYGQSFLTNDAEETLVMEMNKQARSGEHANRLATAKSILSINPLNLDALISAGIVLTEMAKDSTVQASGAPVEDAKPYFRKAMRIFNTIAATGDGSEAHPFYVTKVSDEYNFMRYYLELWEYDTQSATACCDVFTLSKLSEYYIKPTIYFEITRVYELERMMFQSNATKIIKEKLTGQNLNL